MTTQPTTPGTGRNGGSTAPGGGSTARSNAALFEAALAVIPGGVSSPVRAFGSVGGVPRFIDSARGAWVRDAEGRDYVDLVGTWGPALLGHAHPEVVEAVRQAAARGLSFGAPTEAETLLAQEVRRRVPAAERVRFVSTGTEATMTAVRLARGATGRDLVVKLAGCYHGHSDGLLAQAGSGVATGGLPGSAGVPGAVAAQTIVLPYNDLPALEACLDQRGSEVAAVILEGAAANMGVVPPLPGYTAGVRRLTQKHGALMILDEVLTGFRVGPAGWWGLDAVEGWQADGAGGPLPGGPLPGGSLSGATPPEPRLPGAPLSGSSLPGAPMEPLPGTAGGPAGDPAPAAHLPAPQTRGTRGSVGAAGDSPGSHSWPVSTQAASWVPDLLTFGKVVGGGMPLAAVGGRTEVMDLLAPLGPVYQAGTLSGNPLATAAGLATFRLADDAVYQAVDAAARQVAQVVSEALSAQGVPHRVQRAGSLFSVMFGQQAASDGVHDYESAQAQETWRFAPFFRAFLQAGVALPPSVFEAWFLSAAHGDAELEAVAAAAPSAARAAAQARAL